MKTFLLSFMIPLLASPVLAFATPDTTDLRQEIGWFTGTDVVVDETASMFTAVHRVTMADRSLCSAVMIAPKIALTAAHCLRADVLYWEQDLGHAWGARIAIQETAVARNFRSSRNVHDYSNEDWGFLVLERAVPKGVAIMEIARPEELYVGQPARSVGYPSFIGDANQRVVGRKCSLRGFAGDNILTDCYMSQGMSGGPLLVKTRDGQWKIAGVGSELYTKSNGEMIYDAPYENKNANCYTNITLYRKRIYPQNPSPKTNI